MKLSARLLSAGLAALLATAGGVLSAAPASAATTTIYAAPEGSGTSCSGSSPCSLAQAQVAVRNASSSGDVVVELAGGRYQLDSPLRFTAQDGGQGNFFVTWRAAPGASPVVTGASTVTGWSQYDASKNIWQAAIPAGIDSRDLYVNGKAQPRASLSVSRGDIDLTNSGMNLKTSALQALAQLPQQNRIEFRAKNNFTDRYAPVVKIANGVAEMAQPAWRNNLWGYDTIPSPGAPHQILSFENALSFISDPGEWYIDPAAGRLYYKPADGVNPSSVDVQLPRLQSLISIGGTYDAPTRNLTFQGIQFSGTSWLGPSSADGLASQQAGAYIKGSRDYMPADAMSCSNGCAAFERARTTWSQQPAAVQVSAAKNISFVGNTFTGLGQIGLGIGNDANAMTSGVGLGAQGVTVRGNIFTQLGGGGIVAGGILADAHHPSRAEMTNANITIDANTIVATSFTYADNSGILSTYVDTASITRNEVAQLPYDGIDIGYGWGVNDPGGSGDYEQRGYYQYNPRYDTPTTYKNNTVANNLVHDTKQVFGDGGALYTLSTAPNSAIRDNYVYAVRGTIGVYLDEGTSDMSVKNNVLRDIGPWLWMNTGAGRNMRNNIADGNWHMGGYVYGDTSTESGNKVINDHPVSGGVWPAEAQAIICQTGVPTEYRNSLTTNPCPPAQPLTDGWKSFSSAPQSRFSQTTPSFSIGAAGRDIWGFNGQRDDQYGAIYRDDSFGDNSSVIARVDRLADTNEWAKSGVFVRNDITQPGSSAGYAALVLTPQHGVSFEWDSDGDGYLDRGSEVAAAADAPLWVRLTRSGTTITGSFSKDKLSWTQVGQPVSVAGLANVQDAGIISTSHDASRYAANALSSVQIASGVTSPWQVTATSEARVTQTASNAVTLGAAGADIWGAGGQRDDAYGAVFQPDRLSDGGSVSARVEQKDANAWAKSGVAVRNDFTRSGAAAGYAVMATTPGNGVSLQWDSDGDGYLDRLTSASTPAGAIWLRLTRSGNNVIGSYSLNGTSWTNVGTAPLAGADSALDAGVISSSHNAQALAGNLFSEIAVR